MPNVRYGRGHRHAGDRSTLTRITRFATGAVLTVGLVTAGAAHAGAPKLPDKVVSEWEERMVEYGRKTGETLLRLDDLDARLAHQYYDAQWVFLRIAEYTGDKQPWTKYADAAAKAYAQYMEESNYQVSGYRKFPHGLYVDWKLNGDSKSREQLLRLREDSVFSNPTSSGAKVWFEQRRSREVAYSLQTEVLAARAGADNPKRRKRFADMALRHIKSWTTGSYVNDDPQLQFCQSFMAGLTASALIAHYQYTAELGNPDERVPKALRTLADWLWDEMWVSNVNGTGYGAFKYVSPPREKVGSGGPAPDLNMLIAPMYGWLYQHTGDAKYAKRGDAIFAGGVELGDLGHGKRFNQSYRSSFDYLMWRTGGAGKHAASGATTAWSAQSAAAAGSKSGPARRMEQRSRVPARLGR